MKNKISAIQRLAFALFTLFVITPLVWAQVGTGGISGRVADSTGAAVVGAKVTITALGTGVVTSPVSNSEGLYVAPDLNVGSYNIEVQAVGFKLQRHVGVEVTVGRRVSLDFNLAVGEQSETVTISGGESVVETATADQSAQIGQKQIRELPLNGRNFEQLILLAPGVQQVTSNTQNSFFGRAPSYSVAGSRPEGQELLLDGVSIQGFWNHGAGNSIIGTSLGVEAIGQFQVLTNTYSARFGGSGSVMNATTRSGTNEFHGTAFNFLRNSVFDARNYFNTDNLPKDSFRRNQFGGAISGPLVKNKMFFFGNYEGIRQQLGLTTLPTLPDENARRGLLPCAAAPGVPCDPKTNLANVGVNPAVAPVLALFPKLTSSAISIGNGVAIDAARGFQPANEDYANARVDYTLNQRDTLFARYVFDNGVLTDPFAIPPGLFPEVSEGRNQFFSIGARRLISPTRVNDLRFSFARTRMAAYTNTSFPALDFFPGEGRQNGLVLIPGVSPLGPSSFTPNFEIQNTFTVGDDMFWTLGKHTLEFGAEYRRQQSNLANGFFSAGDWFFPSLAAFLQNQPSLFLGALPKSANSYRGFRDWQLYPYIQDTYKALPTLTLNLGLRYSFSSNPVEVNGQLCAFVDPSNPAETGCRQVDRAFKSNPSVKNLDPRIGVAWDPFKDHKTSIRAGLGFFHNRFTARNYHTAFIFAKPYQTGVQPCGVPGLPPCQFPRPFADFAIPIPTIGQSLIYDPQKTPYVVQYNLSLQREIAAGTVLSVSYIGSRGVNLLVQRNTNPPVPKIVNGRRNFAGAPIIPGLPETIGTSAAPRNPNLGSLTYGVPDAPSWYNSLQVYLTRNFSDRLQFQVAYTYSKCLDQGSKAFGLESGNSAQTQYDPYDQSLDKGLCDFDIRHNLVANTVYAFPFQRNRLVKGWQYSVILSARSGSPFTVYDGFDRAGLNDAAGIGGAQRPDLVSGRSNNPIVGRPDKWFDATAFSLQAPGFLGNLGRNTLVGPKYLTFDMALAKNTKLTERVNMDFRVEGFNIFNRPNFGLPDPILFTGPDCTGYPVIPGLNFNCPGPGIRNPHAGVISNTVSTARQLQFGLKLSF